VPVVSDDGPLRVLDALAGPGPVAVTDHRRPVPAHLPAGLEHAPPGTWLVALTSGSTAAPRAVCRTAASWLAGVEPFARLTGTARGTRVLVPGPLSSTLFLHAAWHARQVGGRPLTEPLTTSRPWDVVHVVPHLLRRLLDEPGLDLSGRTAVVAGAALPPALAARARERGLRVVAYYGAAELSFVAAGEPAASGALPLFPRVVVRVRDGEVWVRSPYLALGYLPGSAPGPMRRDSDGWVSVGDRGSVGADGRLTVLGRGNAVVQTGGATVLVADVEAALRQLPGVADAVVVGVPHPALGAVVAAVVEAGPGAPDLPGLRQAAAAALAAPQRPRRWLLVDALPRTPGGKVDRAATAALLGTPPV